MPTLDIDKLKEIATVKTQPDWVPKGAGGIQENNREQIDIIPDLDDFSMADLIALYNHWHDYIMKGGYTLQNDFDIAVDQMTTELLAEINYRCSEVFPKFQFAWLNQED